MIKLKLKEFKLKILQLKKLKVTSTLTIDYSPESNITNFMYPFIIISKSNENSAVLKNLVKEYKN